MTHNRNPEGIVQPEEVERFKNYFQRYFDFIPEYEQFLDVLFRRHKRAIRINTLKTSVAECKMRLEKLGATLTAFPAGRHLFILENMERPGNSVEYLAGYFHVQAISSALAALALDPQPGERILDLCAAPGSKTTYMAQLMENRGIIVANEKKWGRVSPLVTDLGRMGVTNCVISTYPGEHFPSRFLFDRVLVDAPCSGEGRHRLVGRPPLDFSENVQKRLPKLQKKLIVRAFDLLKPGGTLLYSTCTYNPEENESVVAYLLENRPAKLIPIRLDLDLDPGVEQWKEDVYGRRMQECVRIYPHRIDSVGFFMAGVVKPR